MQKRLAGFFFVAFFSITFFSGSSIVQAYYQDDDGRYIVNEDETWRKDGTYVFDNEVIIDLGATLTMEPGTTVSFGRDHNGDAIPFSVYDGQVRAIGTEAEPIVFRRKDDNGAFYINFSDSGEKTSTFRYVRFLEGGDAWYIDACTDCQQTFLWDFLIHRALAAQQRVGTETLRYSYGSLSIQHSVFSNSAFMDVSAVDSRIYNITDEDGNIIGKDPARLIISNSDFSGDTSVPALQVYDSGCPYVDPNCQKKIIFTDDWYGSPSGPNTEDNSSGTGKQIIGKINRIGFSDRAHFCLENCHSSVMFLPGMLGSRLYDDQDSFCVAEKTDPKRAWEPSCNTDVRKLYLGPDGKSLDPDIHTKDKDILDEASLGGANIYKSFIETMDAMRDTDHLMKDWKPIAYDWRLSYNDILSDGLIENALKNLAQDSNTGKVTIIAHSNGGLLAKALMRKLGDVDTAKLIDQVILVAVPQVGTPETVVGMLNGERQNIFPILDSETARGLSENMPGAYQLLPSEKYFSTVQTPPVTFDISDISDLKGRYEDAITSKGKLDDFLTDAHRRVAAVDGDTETPSVLKGGFLGSANSAHDSLDGWTAPNGVRVIQIAGWGVPATIKGAQYVSEKKEHCDESLCTVADYLKLGDIDSTIDGDGTVVFPSALYMGGGAERYWVDLAEYNRSLDRITNLQFLGIDHKDILEIPELIAFIVDSVVGDSQPLSSYEYLSAEIPASDDEKRIQYSLHSPLTLDLYDDLGRHTGIRPDGTVEESIPGTYYRQYGDVKYIFADESSPMRISMSGYAVGTFMFSVKELQGDTEIGAVTFKDMPTTPETEVSFDMPSDLAHAGNLRIDVDGDEVVDHELQPKIGGVVTLEEKDAVAPVSTLSLSGTQGTNGWYTSDVAVTLTATDEEGGSGIDKTEYSLNGIDWVVYTDSFVISIEGTTTLQYRSIDKTGNQEETKIATIKIDKTAPEAKIAFNPITQKLEIIGKDNLSDATVTITETVIPTSEPGSRKGKAWNDKKGESVYVATIADQVGHTTSLSFEKQEHKGNLFVRLLSMGYDGEEEKNLKNTSLGYIWHMDRKGRYLDFSSSLVSEDSRLMSAYLPRQDRTIILEQEKRHLPRLTSEQGMVVLYMESSKGSMEMKR